MEILVEFICELVGEILGAILEGIGELATNKKISPVIRYPALTLIILIYGGLVIGIFVLGVMIFDKSILLSAILIVMSIVILVATGRGFRKKHLEKNGK